MNPTLVALQTKIQWAEKHFSDFKDIAFGRSRGIDTRQTTISHYRLERQPDPGPTEIAVPTRECRLAFGDAVHQLRSCLDHIVYALVKPRTSDTKVLRKVDFPIYANEKRFEDSKVFSLLRDLLTVDELTEVVLAQPYKRTPAAPDTDWLWILSELDNIDKHRSVLVVDPRLFRVATTTTGDIRKVKSPLEPSAQGFSVPLPAIPAPDEVNVEQSLLIVVAATGLSCDNTTAVHIWRSMIGEVKRTVTNFERALRGIEWVTLDRFHEARAVSG